MKAPQDSIRLFKNPLLEKLTHVHPATPAIMWLPVIGLLLWRSFVTLNLSAMSVFLVATSAFFFWTLTEYLLHRYVFHFVPHGPISERLVYLFHGIHHDQPDDWTRLVFPPVPAVLFASIFFGIFRFTLGNALAEPCFAFFLLGYLSYDYTHYYVHHFQPSTAWGRFLKSHHMKHHYSDQATRYGVSSPLWDYVFGTIASRASRLVPSALPNEEQHSYSSR